MIRVHLRFELVDLLLQLADFVALGVFVCVEQRFQLFGQGLELLGQFLGDFT